MNTGLSNLNSTPFLNVPTKCLPGRIKVTPSYIPDTLFWIFSSLTCHSHALRWTFLCTSPVAASYALASLSENNAEERTHSGDIGITISTGRPADRAFSSDGFYGANLDFSNLGSRFVLIRLRKRKKKRRARGDAEDPEARWLTITTMTEVDRVDFDLFGVVQWSK